MVILAGPTAAGKTELSVALARQIGGEIISADSMQVYRGMDIGTAKIKKEEMAGIPHHLIDILDPDQEFNVALFQEQAKALVKQIVKRGRIPVIVGGTGFYIQSLVYDIEFTKQKIDQDCRRSLEEMAREKGADYLHALLRDRDPRTAETIHANNVKKVIRALEFYSQTGVPLAEHNEKERQKESPYCFAYFVLNDRREALYQRIEQRVEGMMAQGLLKEVEALRQKGYGRNLVSMQGLGYKELLSFLDGEISREEAVRMIKRDTRRFAKRQITWFRREKDVIWVNQNEFKYDREQILSYIEGMLRMKGIIKC